MRQRYRSFLSRPRSPRGSTPTSPAGQRTTRAGNTASRHRCGGPVSSCSIQNWQHGRRTRSGSVQACVLSTTAWRRYVLSWVSRPDPTSWQSKHWVSSFRVYCAARRIATIATPTFSVSLDPWMPWRLAQAARWSLVLAMVLDTRYLLCLHRVDRGISCIADLS